MPNERDSLQPTDIIAATHVHGPQCEHCGSPTGVERIYAFNDRMIEMLFRAVCHQRGIRTYYKVAARSSTPSDPTARRSTGSMIAYVSWSPDSMPNS